MPTTAEQTQNDAVHYSTGAPEITTKESIENLRAEYTGNAPPADQVRQKRKYSPRKSKSDAVAAPLPSVPDFKLLVSWLVMGIDAVVARLPGNKPLSTWEKDGLTDGGAKVLAKYFPDMGQWDGEIQLATASVEIVASRYLIAKETTDKKSADAHIAASGPVIIKMENGKQESYSDIGPDGERKIDAVKIPENKVTPNNNS